MLALVTVMAKNAIPINSDITATKRQRNKSEQWDIFDWLFDFMKKERYLVLCNYLNIQILAVKIKSP